jgi:hypothetical protein
VQIATLRTKIASRRSTLVRQDVRATERDATARGAERVLEHDKQLAENAAGRLEGRILAGESTDEMLAAAQSELRILDREVGVQIGRAESASERGGAAFAKADETAAAYDRLRDELRDVADEWKRTQEQAAQTPRDQGSIGLSALNGTTFPDEVANVANKYLNAEKPASGHGAVLTETLWALNGLLRGLRATGDASFLAIQGLLGAVSHPVAYARATKTAIRAFADPAAEGKFINDFDIMAQQAGRPDSRAWAAANLRLGASNTEFETGAGIRGHIGSAIRNAPILKQSNRMFGTFGDVMRLEAADAIYSGRKAAGMGVDAPDEMQDIARGAGLISGWSENDLGVPGQVAQFAPRFFRSQLDLTAHALLSGQLKGRQSATGDEARRALLRLLGVGIGVTVAANEARGYDTDFSGPNMLRIRNVGGEDISLFGPWQSFFTLITETVKGNPTYALRTKASPVVSLAWDYFSGEDFIDRPTRDGAIPRLDFLLRSISPFAWEDIPGAVMEAGDQVQAGDIVEAAKDLGGAVALGESGLKASPLTPAEELGLQRDEAVAELTPEQSGGAKTFEELAKAVGSQRARAMLDGLVEGQAEYDANREKKLREDAERGDRTAMALLVSIDTKERIADLADAGLSNKQYRDARRTIKAEQRGAAAQYRDVFEGFAQRGGQVDTDTDAFFELYDKARGPGGLLDQEAFESLEAEFVAKIGAERWAKVEDNLDATVGDLPEQEREYRAVNEVLNKTGFFEIRDETWDTIKKQKELQPMLKGARNYFEWRDKMIDETEQKLIAGGFNKSLARGEAADAIESHPLYDAYNELRNILETEWITSHVEDDAAEMAIAWGYIVANPDEEDAIMSHPSNRP